MEHLITSTALIEMEMVDAPQTTLKFGVYQDDFVILLFLKYTALCDRIAP